VVPPPARRLTAFTAEFDFPRGVRKQLVRSVIGAAKAGDLLLLSTGGPKAKMMENDHLCQAAQGG
jgi:hypothetical protein